jgi:2-polyprenyl-3-methyl-5-hydroxy-6-metoxy-1,4-benzoquinol methylase
MSLERQEINKISPWWGEHLHRYDEVVKSLSGNEIILDIACGSGFGTHLLSTKTTGTVYGGDLSSEAIDLCDNSWNKDNLSYEIMDGTKLKFEDNTFDVVVSFETIEHTKRYHEMIKELKRVVKPNGIIYLSTPNIKINSPTGIVTNPYHTQEWDYEEFNKIVNKHFNSYKIFGQKYNRYKNKKNITFYIEKLLYKRGIRKIPNYIQNKIMNLFGQPTIYPSSSDYTMIETTAKIVSCKTFFCICKN